MELHAIRAALRILESSDRGRRRRSDDACARRRCDDRVSMAHPADLLAGLVAEELAGLTDHLELGTPELGRVGAGDFAAELLRHELHAVADAEHRQPELEQPRIDARGVVGVHRRGPAGEDDGSSLAADRLCRRDRTRHELRVHAALAHSPGDQLSVLATEVEYEHGPGRRLALRRGRSCLSLGRVQRDLRHVGHRRTGASSKRGSSATLWSSLHGGDGSRAGRLQ